MSDSLGPPPKGGDVNRAPLMLGVTGALGLVSVSCAAARLYTRIRLLRAPGFDDAVILFCAVSDVPPKKGERFTHLLRYWLYRILRCWPKVQRSA